MSQQDNTPEVLAATIAQAVKDAQIGIELEDWAASPNDPIYSEVRSYYLGRYMYLDPCGRYHHIISPNGVTEQCEQFWADLEAALDKAGFVLEAGEGDPTDVYASQYRWNQSAQESEALMEEAQ